MYEDKVFHRDDGTSFETKEGVAALEDAIAFIEKQPILPHLEWSQELYMAAQELVNDIGPSGEVSHVTSEGKSLENRLARHGKFLITCAESLVVAEHTGLEAVIN